MYWIGYEQPFATNVPLDEARWKANIDWIAANFKQYGYSMVSTDGWIEGAIQTDQNGYVLKYNDSWQNGWPYWENYAAQQGLTMGVYYNPLWVTQAAVDDPAKTVVGTTIPIRNIVRPGDMFNGNPDPTKQLYWVDVIKPGAKEYIQGYVNYFKQMGIKFLRVDFLSWYESGTLAGAPARAVAHGSTNFATAINWMQQAAGNDMVLSLVMPNLFNHAADEKQYGDMVRIDDDCANSGWTQICQGSFGDTRQTWQNTWSQWANPFMGFTGFSDLSGRGQLILDGDFFRINMFNTNGTVTSQNVDEQKTAITLFTMAGSPIAIADQYDTIGNNAWVYQNQELINIHNDGFVGKPVYYNGNPYQPSVSGQVSTGSRDSERWIGQTSDGNWVVALFNRADTAQTKSLDFPSILGLQNGAYVRDLWVHTDLGLKTNQTVTLDPHATSFIKVTPNTATPTINRYEAEVSSWRSGAHFDNVNASFSAMGYVDQLDGNHPGANVVFAVHAPTTGTYDLNIGYANGNYSSSTATYTVNDSNNNQLATGQVSLPNLTNWSTWGNVQQNIPLSQGLNYITIARNSNDTGSFKLDYIQLNNRT